MIYIADKAAADVVDYNLDMTNYIPPGFSIDAVTVTVTECGTGESPLALEAFDASSQPLAEGDPDNVCVLFWLRGGTPGQRYRGVIAFSDDESVDPDRSYTRQFQVEVSETL